MSSVMFESDPSGAEVELDGTYVGTTPFDIEIGEPTSDFHTTCLHNGGVICDWNTLRSYLEDQTVKRLWWSLTRDERYSIAETAFNNTLYGYIRYYRHGHDKCAGGYGDWLPAECASNGAIKYLKFASPVFEYQDECVFESCYWKFGVGDVEHCYRHNRYYDLPCALVQARPKEGIAVGSHIMCAIQIDENVAELDSWVIFQWKDFDIQPGVGQLDCSNFDIFKPGTMGCRGGGKRTYFLHIDL